MSDRVKGLVVTLKNDIKDEDADHVVSLLKAIRDVATVKPVQAGFEDYMNRDQIRVELWEQVKDILWPYK